MRWAQGMSCRSAVLYTFAVLCCNGHPCKALDIECQTSLPLLFLLFFSWRHSPLTRLYFKQTGVYNCWGRWTNPVTLLSSTRRRRRWTAEEKDRAQRSPGAGSLARAPLRCCAAAGVVNQAVTSRRTATSQHQGRTAPRFHRRLEKSSVSCGRARDVEHLLAASTQAQTCKGNQVLNSYLGTSLPLKSEIEVRPLNISVGLAPKPCVAVQCRASAGTGQHCQQHGHCPFTCHMNVKEQEAFIKLWKTVKNTPLHAPCVVLPDSHICGPCLWFIRIPSLSQHPSTYSL